MDLAWSVKVLEHCQVSPPPNSTPPTISIPLTFLDIPWLPVPPVQRVFFYEIHHPTHHITQTILPKLKHSLSLTLQHFFPLAGTVVCHSQPPTVKQPHILYKDGDSIPLIVAESNGDFDHLVKNYSRDATEFRPLVPELQSPERRNVSPSNETQVVEQLLRPLIAIQVTIFPNSGICISYSYRHVVGDGRAIAQFIKSWATIFKSDGDYLFSVDKLIMLPIHDRAAVNKDQIGLLTYSYNQWCEVEFSGNDIENPNGSKDIDNVVAATATAPIEEKVRTTFVLSSRDFDKLKDVITSQFKTNNEVPPLPHVSRFVAACTFVWVCLVKTESFVSSNDKKIYKPEANLLFAADRRESKDLYVPKNYFGNCLTPCLASVKRSDLIGENGLMMAAKAIMNEVKGLDSGLLKGVEKLITEVTNIIISGNLVSVAGSPKFGLYDTDFGWGKPKTIETVHIDMTGSFSMTECRDEEGGIEIGLALSKTEMEAFISIFELGLKK